MGVRRPRAKHPRRWCSVEPNTRASQRQWAREYAQFPALDASHPDNKGKPGDADADGLPDEWEIRNLLSFAQGSTDDPDGDGKNNAAEFAAKSDPLSP